MIKSKIFSYILMSLFLLFFLSMHPFLKYPFDVHFHLSEISDFYTNLDRVPVKGKEYWYIWWDKFFHLINLDNSKYFLRAYIIHYSSIVIDFFAIYFFNFTILHYLFKKIDRVSNRFLALWATFIWFIIFATSSMGIHLVWIQWYSINYQITLPLILLATGLLLHILFGNLTNSMKILYAIFMLAIFYIVLRIHSMEFLYFLMYLAVLILVFIDKVSSFIKKYKVFIILALIPIIFIILNLKEVVYLISNTEPALIKYMLNGEFKGLWLKILADGTILVNSLNRAWASMNELIYLSLFLIPFIIVLTIFEKQKKLNIINIRVMLFIIVTSLFVLIPLFKVTAGLASVLVHIHVVNRFYYSSTIFLIIPIFFWYIIRFFKIKNSLLLINILIPLTILATFYYSRFNISSNQNFYKNIISIKNSFNERKVGFNLSKEQIETIRDIAQKYKEQIGQEPYFYAREDIAYILKMIYNKSVYLPLSWRGVRLKKDFYIKAYNKDTTHKNKVLFKTPKGFPPYEPYK